MNVNLNYLHQSLTRQPAEPPALRHQDVSCCFRHMAAPFLRHLIQEHLFAGGKRERNLTSCTWAWAEVTASKLTMLNRVCSRLFVLSVRFNAADQSVCWNKPTDWSVLSQFPAEIRENGLIPSVTLPRSIWSDTNTQQRHTQSPLWLLFEN